MSSVSEQTSLAIFGQAARAVLEGETEAERRGLCDEERVAFDRAALFHARRLHPDAQAAARAAGLPRRLRRIWSAALDVRCAPIQGLREGISRADFAWLLGTYAAVRRSPAGDHPRPVRLRLEENEARYHSDQMERLFARRPALRKVSADRFDCFFGDKQLSRVLHELSEANRRVPWEYVAQLDERRGFLRAFLRRRSAVTSDLPRRLCFSINKGMDPSLRDDILRLIAGFDIDPNPSAQRITIQARSELQRLLAADLLIPERDQALRQAMTVVDDGAAGRRRLQAIIKACARGQDGQRHKLRRVRLLARLSSEGPDPDVLAFLHRRFGIARGGAALIAGKRSLREVLETSALFEGVPPPEELRDAWLARRPEWVSEQLGQQEGTRLAVAGETFVLSRRARLGYLQAYGLSPEEIEDDFSLCLQHIRDELGQALERGAGKGKAASSSLVFSLEGKTIRGIRLAVHG